MERIILIATAGALGTLARYGLSGAAHRVLGTGFPWGTMAANLLGAFLFGLVWSLAEDRMVISGETRLIVLTGFMGAFTTFSTFMFESGQLLKDGQYLYMGINLIAQNATGLVLLFAGLALGRLI